MFHQLHIKNVSKLHCTI